MADIHRRIELQETEDFRYLIANVRRVATAQIDENLPPVEGEDPLRARVQDLVNNYVSQIFKTAAPNLFVNNQITTTALMTSLLSPTSPDASSINGTTPDYARVDTSLLARAQALMAEEELLTIELAELRRTAPARIAASRKAEFDTALATEMAGFEAAAATVAREGKEAGGGTLDVGPLERQEGVERAWRSGVEGLGVLRREMGGTAAKMERAKRAGDYVLAEA